MDCFLTFLIVFLEKNKVLIRAITWRHLENSMLRKKKPDMKSLDSISREIPIIGKFTDRESRLVVVRGRRMGNEEELLCDHEVSF